MRKIASRLAAGLALVLLATPALACEGMKNTTASEKSAKPAVASTSKGEATKAAPSAEAAKPATAAN